MDQTRTRQQAGTISFTLIPRVNYPLLVLVILKIVHSPTKENMRKTKRIKVQGRNWILLEIKIRYKRWLFHLKFLVELSLYWEKLKRGGGLGIFSFFALKLWLGYGVQGARHKWTPIPIPLFFFVFNLGIKKIGVGSRVILWTENLINSFIHTHIPSFVTQSSVFTP